MNRATCMWIESTINNGLTTNTLRRTAAEQLNYDDYDGGIERYLYPFN